MVMNKDKVPPLRLNNESTNDKMHPPKVESNTLAVDNKECDVKSRELSGDSRPPGKKVPQGMTLPSFPKVEGGRDFDEEVEERIRLTHAYNTQIADSNIRALSARGLMKT